jgi:hypothetical protein
VREGRVPPALQAHSHIVALCNLRSESTVAHDGEQARADRTRLAEAGGSPRRTLNRTALRLAGLGGLGGFGVFAREIGVDTRTRHRCPRLLDPGGREIDVEG